MVRAFRWSTTFLILGILIAGPALYSSVREQRFRRLHVVREGVLYRSGQMSLSGLKRTLHDHRIKTVISLCPGESEAEKAEAAFCRGAGYRNYQISPRSWWASAGEPPAAENVRLFRQIMDDPANHPVLIHCVGGVHRTGAFCAIYRMEYEGWESDRAVAEMKALAHGQVDEEYDVFGYLEQYCPREKARTPQSAAVRAARFIRNR